MIAMTTAAKTISLRAFIAVALALGVLVATEKPAQAAFPGQNGKIAFESGRDGDLRSTR
jgi:hypothetical protein